MMLLTVVYVAVGFIWALVNAIAYYEPFDSDDRKESARRFFQAPLWPVFAARALIEMWIEANSDDN